MLPALGTALLIAALAWAAAAFAHDKVFPAGRQWWQVLRPDARWTLPVLAVLWVSALALYWWPRRHNRHDISLLALLSMVVVGVILAEASFLPCASGQASVIAPLSWVLALFTGQMEVRFGPGTGCLEQLPLAMQVARVVCLGATFVGVAAAGTVLWRAEIDRLKTRFVGELTMMTGLDDMTVALLGKLVTESGQRKVVIVEADPNHPLLEEVRALGARVIIADPSRAEALRPVLTHLSKPSVRQVFALHPGAQVNETILAEVREVLGQARSDPDHHPHIVARIDDPRHADTWRGNHVWSHQLWLEDALSPYETTAVFAVRAVLAHSARRLVLCGDTTLALAILIEAARSAWELRELREAQEAAGQHPVSGPGFPPILIVAERAKDLQREFSATVSPQFSKALHSVDIAPRPWRSELLEVLDSMPSPDATACVVVITDPPSPEGIHEAGRVARLHPRTAIYAQFADDAGRAGVVFDRLHHFQRGFLVDGELPADTWTRFARHNHESYRLRWPVPAGSPRESARRPWADLDEFYRLENILQVRQVLSSAVRLGRQWCPLRAVPPGSMVELTESERLSIARDEHARWSARRIAAGWRPPRAGEPEDNTRRVNASIVDWEALPDERREANVQHIGSIVERLEAIGYSAVLPAGGPEHASVFARRGEVHAERLAGARLWTASDGSAMRAQHGDWRVRDEEGSERSVRDAEFLATHEQVNGHRWLRTGEVLAWQVREPTTVRTLEGPATAAVGDWIVQGPGGVRWPVPASQFERSHVARPDRLPAAGDGQPAPR